MQSLVLVITALVCLWQPVSAITKYDFNVCRIQFCSDKEAACIGDQDYCMDSFAKTRACFQTCTSDEQKLTYNKCWATCKQSNALSNNMLYAQVGACYEQVCYLSAQGLSLLLGLLIFVTALMI